MSAASPFVPSDTEKLARARSDLRMGLPVVLERAGERALVAGAEVIDAERLRAFAGDGAAALALTHWRAATLKIAAYDGDLVRLALPRDVTPARLAAIVDPAGDLASPLKGPFAALRSGDAGPARAGLALAKSARLLPAVLLRPLDAVPEGLTRLDAAAVSGAPLAATDLDEVIAARLPLSGAPLTRLRIWRPRNGADEHYAVEIGRPDRTGPVLVRLHSACFTGDVLGSLKCDCGPQLHGALEQMAQAGAGVLLYLNQEGRGIGLANKMRAYALQDQGFDTVEANHRLGFEDDERDFAVGAAILRRSGIATVRLLTNNPRKVEMLERCGVAVAERVPLWVGRNPLNDAYLTTKAQKSGHLE